MEDNNNNLGDFFKKRLSSLEGEDQDWFNPDPRTDAQVLKGLVVNSKKRKNNKQWLLILPFLFFVGTLAYVFHLKQQVTDLTRDKEQLVLDLVPKHSIINAEEKSTRVLSEENLINNQEINNEKVNIENEEAKNVDQLDLVEQLVIEKQKLKQLVTQKEAKIQALQLELSEKCNPKEVYANFVDPNNIPVFENLLASKTKVESASINKLGKSFSPTGVFSNNGVPNSLLTLDPTALEESKQFRDLAVIKPELLTNPLDMGNPNPDYSFSLKKKQKRRLKSLEVGLHLGLQMLITEKEIDILNQRIIGSNTAIDGGELTAPYAGISIAYAPVKNLWIRIAAHGGGSRNQSGQKMGIIYNDLEEYSLPSGDVGIDFVLNSSTGYTKAINTLQVTVPNGTTNGDLFELDYFQELRTTHIQVPVSIEYFFGSKKWQPFIHIGAKWNIFHYEWEWNVPYVTINSRGQEVSFNLKNVQENVKTFQYMSFMTGAGLNWNFRPRFSLRTTFGMEYNVLLDDVNNITNSDFSRNGFFVTNGLYYKF